MDLATFVLIAGIINIYVGLRKMRHWDRFALTFVGLGVALVASVVVIMLGTIFGIGD